MTAALPPERELGRGPMALEAGGDDATFVVELPEFSGPLDLLLTLIRDEQVDITDIPVARIAEQFLARISAMGLNEAADYLEMAARLLRIKAQLLLPRPDGEEWEDPRAELVRRLLEYQQIREVVDLLDRLAEDRRQRYERAYVQESIVPAEPPELAISLQELLGALDRIRRLARDPEIHDVIPRPLDVEGAMASVRAALRHSAHLRWGDLLPSDPDRWHVLSFLLALLELARRGELRIAQRRPFAPPEITGDAASEAA